MRTDEAYKVLGLEENAGYEEARFRYRSLAKSTHPDITKKDNNAIRVLNEAYALVSEEIERRKAEKLKITRNIEIILKGVRLAMKRYASDLYIAKRKNAIRIERMKEFSALLGYLKEIEGQADNPAYKSCVSFVKSIIKFELLPVEIEIKNVSERKAYFIYNSIVNQSVRVLEEVFIRLDGIKKRTGLWLYYIGKSLEDYELLKSLNCERISNMLSFLPSMFDDIKTLAAIFRTHTSLLSYKDFFDLFTKEKMIRLGKLAEEMFYKDGKK